MLAVVLGIKQCSNSKTHCIYVNTELSVIGHQVCFSHSLQMNCSGTGIAMGPMVARSFFYAVSETADCSSLATQNEVLIMDRLMQGSVNVFCIHTGLNSDILLLGRCLIIVG